jgi:hypothetical protein
MLGGRSNPHVGHPAKEYALSLDIAKEGTS